MLTIAICEDDPIFQKFLSDKLTNITYPSKILIFHFASGEALLKAVESGEKYDIVFFDVHLQGMSGNDAARLLRKKSRDVILIFCSGIQLTIPPYLIRETQPFSYLLKTYSDSQMNKEIELILKEYRKKGLNQKKYIELNCCDFGIKKICLNEIAYFTNEKREIRRKVVAKFAKTVKKIYTEEALNSIYEKTSVLGFEFCHNSYLVNLGYVVLISHNKQLLQLENEEQLAISRSKADHFAERFSNYLIESNGIKSRGENQIKS